MNTLIQARIDSEVKKDAEDIMNKLGISMNEAIRMFLMQVIIHKGIPFKPVLRDEEPSIVLKQAIDDVENKKGLTRYKNTDEMWEDLGL